VVESHNEVVATQGATTTTTTTSIDGAHNEHEVHGDVNTSHSEAVSRCSEAAEHEEHLTHVLHQLQNKPWAAFYVVVCFPTFQWGLAFYAIQQVAQAGWSPVLFRVMGHNCFFYPCVRYIYYIFNSLWTTLIIYLFG
jgi:hypothetical protein